MSHLETVSVALSQHGELTEDQVTAIVEALYCAMYADGMLAESEPDELAERLSALPVFADKGLMEIQLYFDRGADVVARIEGGADRIAILKEIGARLGSGELRELVFRMAIAVLYADGEINDPERETAGGLATAFQIEKEQARSIVDEEKQRLGIDLRA